MHIPCHYGRYVPEIHDECVSSLYLLLGLFSQKQPKPNSHFCPLTMIAVALWSAGALLRNKPSKRADTNADVNNNAVQSK